MVTVLSLKEQKCEKSNCCPFGAGYAIITRLCSEKLSISIDRQTPERVSSVSHRRPIRVLLVANGITGFPLVRNLGPNQYLSHWSCHKDLCEKAKDAK